MSVQHAVVVGGTRGLGLVVVERLLSRGFDVTVLSRRPASRHEGNSKINHVAVDLEDADSVDGIWTKACDSFGAINYLILCQRFRGQDVLVFDFEGNPEYKPKNIAEHVAQQLAGVVWVDEKQHEVVRLEAYFVRDFRFAGGLLANLQKGTSFIFEQTFLNNEVWLPTYEEAHVGVRVLLIKGFKVNEFTRYSDYQRFHIETLSTIAKPKEPADKTAKEP